MAYKTLFTFNRQEWLDYLSKWPSVPSDVPATPKQVDLMRKIYIPDWVIVQISKRAAVQVIRVRLFESAKWREAANKKKAKAEKPAKVVKKKAAPKITPLIDWDCPVPPFSVPSRHFDELDPCDGLTKEDLVLSENIRTSMVLWLVATVRSDWTVDYEEALEWILEVAGPAFWIKYRRADIDPKKLEEMMEAAMKEKVLMVKEQWDDVM